jgi:subtilisin-like proprotein convertase family protein
MGAIAMDGAGNIALGYNVSSSSVYPGLRYTGRLAGDTLGVMTQGETVLVGGTARNSSNRYGDYAAMSVDPADDCTFWFTGEYNTSTSWSTRIGSFKFDQCGGGPTPTPTVGPSPTPVPTATPTPVPACTTFTSTNVPKIINDRANTTSTVVVSGGTITDVNVTLGQVSHTYDADLDIYIKHPDGTERMLSTDNGGAGDNYISTVFDDEAATAVTSGVAPFTGSYRPEATLSIFDGKAAAGTWTLRIYDDSRGDTGSLQAWSITICTGGATAALSSAPDLAGEMAIAPSTFSVKAGDGGVQIAWRATDAVKVAGFNLYRSAAPGSRGDLVAFIPAGAVDGEYAYLDAAGVQTAWYTLEAIGADGATHQQVMEGLTAAEK